MKFLKFNLLFYFVLISCSKSDFPNYSDLGKLRVLSLVADRPEVSPGDSVQIKPYVSDLNGVAPLSFEAQGCISPNVEYGAEPSCEGNLTSQNLASGSLVQPNSSNNYTGEADSFTFSVPSSQDIFSGRSERDQYNGVSYLVTYRLMASDGRSVSSYKRIVVSTRSIKNTNPVIADIVNDGVGYNSLLYGQGVALNLSISSGPETFYFMNSDGTIAEEQEDLTFTWFISDGEIKASRTVQGESNEYTNPGEIPQGRDAFIIVTARDNRGGNNILIKKYTH